MSIRNPIAVALLALFAGLALVIPGVAKAEGEPTYKLSLKGSQVITWSQSHTPQFACDATVSGNGSQSITYRTFDPSRVELVRPKGAPALLASPSDDLAEYGAPQEMTGDATIMREGVQNIDSPGGTCGGVGGGGEPPAPDCGERDGVLRFGLSYGVGPTAPEGGDNVAGRLKLLARYEVFSDPLTMPVGHSYENCPFWAATASAAGVDEVLVASEKLPVAKLAKLKKGRSLKVSADAEETYPLGDFDGKTLNTWNIKLKRLR